MSESRSKQPGATVSRRAEIDKPYEYLDVVVTDGVAVVTLTAPEKGNAFSARGHTEMTNIWRDLAADDDVRSAVLTGSGANFSVGPERDYFQALSSPDGSALRTSSMREAMQMVEGAIDLDKPVVTALNGVAHGAALAFALLADLVIAERHVTLSDAHVNGGIVAGDGGTMIWPLAMGLNKAKRYLLTGDSVTADEAERLGLVTEVVDTGRSFERALQFATRFAQGPQLAIRSTKRALNQWLRHGALTSFHQAWALELLSMESPDAARAANEFAHRRPGVMPPHSALPALA